MYSPFTLNFALGKCEYEWTRINFSCFFFQVEYKKRKKEEGKKTRLDRDRVKDMLFAAFEKHQYYKEVDLVRLTQQPVVRVRDIYWASAKCDRAVVTVGTTLMYEFTFDKYVQMRCFMSKIRYIEKCQDIWICFEILTWYCGVLGFIH